MAKTTYEVSIDSDDQFFVTVRSDDPDALDAALPWPTRMYHQLKAQEAATWNAGGVTPESESTVADEDETTNDETNPPVCAVHGTPMVQMTGKRGPFWSCHRKDANGRFCSYRPDQA